MGNLEAGVISFSNYEVEEIHFLINKKATEESVEIDTNVSAKVELSDDHKIMNVILYINVFPEAEEKNYPFEMYLQINGEFRVGADEEDINVEQYRKNAVAILFPYARAIISTYTASANVPPLILPTVNINKMLSNQKKTK